MGLGRVYDSLHPESRRNPGGKPRLNTALSTFSVPQVARDQNHSDVRALAWSQPLGDEEGLPEIVVKMHIGKTRPLSTGWTDSQNVGSSAE